MKRFVSALKRFTESNAENRKQKILNRINQILRTHRYVIWHASKKLKIAELTTKKYETFYIQTADNSISKTLFLEGKFDLDKLIKVTRLIDITESTLIDVGANLGSICIPACKRSLVQNAIAIEPDRETFNYLNRNIAANLL